MSWASTRRTLILSSIFSVIAAIFAVVLIATLYETPSCNDEKQNQDEAGVDCGGVCEQVCTLSVLPPVVQFVKDVPGPGNRVDVVAYVENKNGDSAARSISYEIEMFGENQELLAKKGGTVDLPPGTGIPIYIQNVYVGGAPVAQVFMTFDESASPWYQYTGRYSIPRVEDIQTSGTDAEPKVTATIKNPTAEVLRGIKVIATVFNEDNNAIAASQTILPEITAEGSATATFTWSEPFIGSAARIDVRPIMPISDL